MLTLLTLINVVHVQDTAKNPSEPQCVNDLQPITTTYWTDWYSSNDSLTDVGEQEDFSEVCSPIEETECREKFTHRSLASTTLSFAISCENGVLRCVNAETELNQTCVDMEMRLKCSIPRDALPDPKFHWSLSELDSGNTRGAIESWNCGGGTLVDQVTPIKGDLFGHVDGYGLTKGNSPNSQLTRCAVQTNGLSSLAFKPFVQSCLTDLACCNPANGITVSFWFVRKEIQTIPLHVFRSPYLLATLQESEETYLIVTYRHGNEMSTVRAIIPHSIWRFVTITCGPDARDLKVYLNKVEVNDTVSNITQGAWSSLAEFQAANASFQVFTTEGSAGVTSSDVRQIRITDLRIYYDALSPEDVKRVYTSELGQDLPAKVIRMQTQRTLFLDSLTQANIDHIWLHCLIRVHYEARVSVRFMYTNDVGNGPFQEMTPDVFKMRTYRNRVSNHARMNVKVQILGRYDGQALSLYYTCDTVSDSKVSGYGYEIIGIQDTTNIVEPTYYWTKFFDDGPPVGGEESETKESHQALANADGYDLFCASPVYAECRIKASIPWYDATPTFVPQYDFPCNENGIRCALQVDEDTNQTCPDLEVRYACRTPTPDPTTAANEGGDTGNEGGDTGNEGGDTGNEPSNSGQEEPSTTPPTGHGQQATRAPGTKNTKEPFKNVIKNNLNWIYPVAIVVFGAGIPVIISCYFLWRKKTPEEIEEEILAAEKKEQATKRPTSARGKP